MTAPDGQREVYGFIIPQRGFYGHPEMFTVRGGLKIPKSWHEPAPELAPVEAELFCEGVSVFEAPYDWREDDSGKFFYKPEFRHAGNEYTSFGGSAAGLLFNKMVEFLARFHQKDYSSIRHKLGHDQKVYTVALEQAAVHEMLTGEYRGRNTQRLFTNFGAGITEAVIAGIDRSVYPNEAFDPNQHITAMHLGYAVIEHILDRFPELDATELDGKRLGDLLALAGVKLEGFKAEPLFEDLMPSPESEGVSPDSYTD